MTCCWLSSVHWLSDDTSHHLPRLARQQHDHDLGWMRFPQALVESGGCFRTEPITALGSLLLVAASGHRGGRLISQAFDRFGGGQWAVGPPHQDLTSRRWRWPSICWTMNPPMRTTPTSRHDISASLESLRPTAHCTTPVCLDCLRLKHRMHAESICLIIKA